MADMAGQRPECCYEKIRANSYKSQNRFDSVNMASVFMHKLALVLSQLQEFLMSTNI